METKPCYCADCYEVLSQWGQPAITVFETICEWYITQGYALEILPEELSILQVVDFLEDKGFVLTTDFEDNIAVVPLACECIDGTWMICVQNQVHGHIR